MLFMKLFWLYSQQDSSVDYKKAIFVFISGSILHRIFFSLKITILTFQRF